MRLYLKTRNAMTILGAIAISLALLALPGSAITATPSPAGATLAASALVALAVPVAVGWGCARGDPQLEGVSVRPVRVFDFLLTVLAVSTTSLAALAMHQVGLAPAGAVAARALLVFLGALLAAQPLTGWPIATIVPAIYLVAVAVAGRGEDISHPAPWAWIAADSGEPQSWLLTVAVVVGGFATYLIVRPRAGTSPG